MELLPKIDEKRTRANAELILDSYREQRGFATMPVNPKITSSWGDGTAASTAPKEEYSMQWLRVKARKQSAQSFIDFCDSAIRAVPKADLQALLKIRYCNGFETKHPDQTAIDVLDISNASYFTLKHTALIAVAHYLDVVEYLKN